MSKKTTQNSKRSSFWKYLNPLSWISGGDSIDFSDFSLGDDVDGDGGPDDLILGDRAFAQPNLFLGKYSKEDLWRLLSDWDVIEHIRRRGYNISPDSMDVDTSDVFVHRISLYDESNGSTPLLQIFLRRVFEFEIESVKMPEFLGDDEEARAVMRRLLPPSIRGFRIEWLLLQDYRKEFRRGTFALPGQTFPGLGCARSLSNVLLQVASELNSDALINEPEHAHNALMYTPPFQFVHPMFAAFYDSLLEDLGDDIQKRGLGAVSWAVRLGKLKERGTNRVVIWKPSEQIVGVSKHIKSYLSSREYNESVRKYRTSGRWYIDWSSTDSIVEDRGRPSSVEQSVIRNSALIRREHGRE